MPDYNSLLKKAIDSLNKFTENIPIKEEPKKDVTKPGTPQTQTQTTVKKP